MTERPEVIQISNVSKRFTVHKDKSLKERIVNLAASRRHTERYTAVDNVSLSIKAGESIGLSGANGSGKSTLLKIIGGILSPDSGDVRVRGRVAALLELGAGFHPDLTGRENVYLNGAILGMSDQEINSKFDSIVEFSGIGEFIDTQVKFYSSGMYVRLAFSVAVHSDPDILLVDEVLAVGDEPFQRKCMEKIREFQNEGRSIILVSHSAEQIIDICERAIVLKHGKVIAEGPARDAMTYLHEEYQIQALASAELANQNAGLPSCVIDSVDVIGGLHQFNGGPSVFKPGGDLTLRIKLTAHKQIDNYALCLDIETDRGRHVVGIDTRNVGIELPTLTGSESVDVILPNFMIGEGDFTFNVALFDQNGYEIHSLRHAGLLPVRSGGPSIGVVSVNPKVSIGSTN